MAPGTFAIRLFGRFTVERNGEPLAGLDARKLQELFAYLLIYRRRAHFREGLADLLWGENSGTLSRKHLRQALWELQTSLDIIPGSPESIFTIDAEWIGFNSAAPVWLDLAVFERAAAAVQGVPGAALTREAAETLQEAADLYRGDLLEGCYQDWCLFERERLQNDYLGMLEKLMDFSLAHAAYETGLEYGSRVLRLDRGRERTHYRLMRLNYLAGDRIAAIRQYHQCAAALQEELGVQPSARTLRLYEQIKAEAQHAPADHEPPQPQATSLHAPRLNHLLAQFQNLQTVLTALQSDLAHNIELVEVAVSAAD